MTTSSNAGVPMVLPKKKGEQEGWTSDMEPEQWRGLVGGLLEFFAEEAAEPEHTEDAEFPINPAALDAEFNESNHPRAPDGKFGSGGGGGGGKKEKDLAPALRRTDAEQAAHEKKIAEFRREQDKNEFREGQKRAEASPKNAKMSKLAKGAYHYDKLAEKAEKDGDAAGHKKYEAAARAYHEAYHKVSTAKDAALDEAPKTLYASRPLKNGADLVAWARQAGFAKTLQPDDMHVTLAYSKTPLVYGTVDAALCPSDADVRANGGPRSVEALGNEGAIVLRFESPDLTERWGEMRKAGAAWDHPSFQPHVTFTMDPGDVDLSKVEPYDGLLDFGPERFKEIKSGEDWAAKARGSMVGDEAFDDVEVDDEHDGPWLSCMSRTSRRMYRNKNVPAEAEIGGKTVDVNKMLLHHEVPEKDDLENLLKVFKEEFGREPDEQERKVLYQGAHGRSGTPNEKAYAEANGINWKAWSAWCRGEEAKVEKGPFENEPADADVKPIPHGHGELAATDSALVLAMDKESGRTFDEDGRMHVDEANICKACVSPYKGREIPGWNEETKTHSLGLEPDRIYKLFRDPAEIEKAADTSNVIQLLRKHVPVDVNDHRPYDIAGTTGSKARWEYPFLKNSLHFWTKRDIDDLENEDRAELSPGYHYDPIMEPGTFEGEPFDGRMSNIRFNHIAQIEKGRQGPDVVVGDSADEVLWTIVESALQEMATHA